MNRVAQLNELADRVDALRGADRDLDAEIAEVAYGWKPHWIPADAKGENACEVLTPDGQPYRYNGQRWNYPPMGRVHRGYHCKEYTRDARDDIIPRDYVRRQTAAALRELARVAGR